MPDVADGVRREESTDATNHASKAWTPAPARALEVECELIGCFLRLEELEEDWRELWLSLGDTTPFQSPDWLLPWWKHYGEGQLFSFAFWAGGRLVGLAPLQIFRTASDGGRKVFFSGTGNSDYMDVLSDPAWRTACWTALTTEIRKRSECWDVCSFQRLRQGSPVLDDIADVTGWRMEQREQAPCVAIDLRDSGHGAVMLKRSKSYARKLQGTQPYSFEEATLETLGEFSEALERLHQQRWREQGCRGALGAERDRSFHREVARRFLKSGMLMFYGIRMARQLIAVIYGYRVGQRVYSYLSGFDLQYKQKSVGAITIGYAVQRAINNGYQAFDFMQGKEAYKYTWGGRDKACFVRRIWKEK